MRYFLNKPHVAKLIQIISPVIHGLELVCIYFASQALTGLPGIYGAVLALTVMVLFELTWLPALMLPIVLVGAQMITGLPWFVTLPVFALPYLYNIYFMSRYRHAQKLRKLMQKVTVSAPSRY